MNTKKEIFVNGRFDYVLSVEEEKGKTKYSLFYSDSEEWTNPRGFVMSLTDDGNGFKLSKLRKASRIDYDEAIELSVLLRVYTMLNDYKIEMVNNKIEL